MIRGVKRLLCTLLLLLAAAPAIAGEMPKLLQTGLERWVDVQGFSCRFEQHIYFSDGSGQSYTGSLQIRRPGRFRWQYTMPYEQLYVSDGEGIWHYEPDLLQAQKLQGLDAVDPAAMRLLDGRITPRDVIFLATEMGGAETAFQVQIGVDGPLLWLGFSAAGDLQWLESRDALGNRNRVSLHDVRFVQPPMDLFIFKAPAGVDLVGE